MKKLISIVVCISVLVSFPFYANAYSASSMIVIEQSTGLPLVSIDCDSVRPMASTTKIMTALIVLETLPLDKIVTVPNEAVGIEGSSLYLKQGEKLTVRDLVYGLMLRSGNDAATALAILAGGSVDGFVALMNERAKSLGLSNTNFTNPSGLPDDNHHTTARELAIIAAAAMKNTDFCSIVSQKSVRLSDGRYVQNHNRLLSMYEGAVGIKTGFTKKAGRCLVSAVKKDGIMLICVTLNAPDDWNDHISAYDYAFSRVSYGVIVPKEQLSVPLVTPDGETVYAKNSSDISALSFLDYTVSQKVLAPEFIYAPKAKGQTVAYVKYYIDGIEIAACPLSLENALDIQIQKQTRISKFFNFLKGLFK